MRQISLMVTAVFVLGALSACGNQPVSGRDAPTPADAGPSASPGPSIWGAVSGVVRDRAGRPVAGVLVVPTAVDPSTPHVPEMAVSTDGHGRYEWHLLPGRYRLVVHRGGRSSSSQVVSLTAAHRSTIDLTLAG
jgi:hypothetical protein